LTTGESYLTDEAKHKKIDYKIIKTPSPTKISKLLSFSPETSPRLIFHDSEVYKYIPKKNPKKADVFKSIVFLHDYDWEKQQYPASKHFLRADIIIVSSNYAKNLLRDLNVSMNKVRLIPKTVYLKRFNPSASPQPVLVRLNVPPEISLIGSVSRFDNSLNYGRIIETMEYCLAEFDDTEFLFIGEGPQRKQFIRLVEEKGMGNKTLFTGFQDNIPQFFAAIDIYYHATFVDQLTYSVVEAIALGKPIVAPNLSSIREFLQHEKHGLFYSFDNPKAAFKMISRFRSNPEFQAAVKENNTKLAKETFSLERNAVKLLKIIEDSFTEEK
jgi:glycosyltransferase involved in cell wall biosynthesis